MTDLLAGRSWASTDTEGQQGGDLQVRTVREALEIFLLSKNANNAAASTVHAAFATLQIVGIH